MEQDNKLKLSTTILDMKFMKRTKDRVAREEDDAEGKAMYSNEITEGMRNSGHLILKETSIANCKDLIDGRLSFGGMNPSIEKLMKSDYAKRLEEVERKREQDFDDVEMAAGFSSVNNTIAKKFKNKKTSKNKKFIKPADD